MTDGAARAVPVRVFISYAHDSAAHQDAVRDLWVFLLNNGFDARLDLPVAERRVDWPVWMLHEVRAADFVVVVGSPAYKRRAEGDAAVDEGRGVQWEAALIREEFYADRVKGLAKFVPVVLPGQSAALGIPAWLGPTTASCYAVPEFTIAGAERLIRYLSGQPFEIERHPIGTVPVLPPRTTGSAPVALPIPGLRTLVLLRVRYEGGELVTETVVAGTALGTRRARLPSELTTDVWAVLKETPMIAAAGLVTAGRALTTALLDADTHRVLTRLVDRIRPGGGVDVLIDGEGPALELPFELLRLTTPEGMDLGPVCLLGGVTLTRRPPGTATGAAPLPGPLKILAAIAAPNETKTANTPLDVEGEMQAMLHAVSDLTAGGGQVRILEVASLTQIQTALDAKEDGIQPGIGHYHVLHLSAHGSATSIELEDEDGNPAPVESRELMQALRSAGRPLPLIVLSACSGGDGNGEAMAAGLIAQGADRVIAMQTSVTDTYAAALAKALYTAINTHPSEPVARALARARQQVAIEQAQQARTDHRPVPPEYGVATLLTTGADPALIDPTLIPKPLIQPTQQQQGLSVRELPIGYLIGRRPQLRTAMAVLRRTPAAIDEFGAVSGVVLCGPGGIGKTAITGRVITRLQQEGWAVAVHDGPWNPTALLTAVTDAIVTQPQLLGTHPEAAAAAATISDPTIDDIKKIPPLGVLLRRIQLLVVFDDFEQNLDTGGHRFLDAAAEDTLAVLADATGTGALLFTCRYPIPGDRIDLVRIDVPALSPAEQRRMYLRLPNLRDLDPADWNLLTTTIGGHPRLTEFVDALLRGGRVNFKHISSKLGKLADDTRITLTDRRDLQTAAEQAMLLGAADILLEDLRSQISDQTGRRVLRQTCVCRAKITLDDLRYALTNEPDDAPGNAPNGLIEIDGLVGAVRTLTDLTLISSTTTDQDTVTIGMLPWIADRLEHGSELDLTIEHQRALAMHYRRLELGHRDYGELLDITRHLGRLGRYDELAGVAEQTTRHLGGTLAVTAFLAEIRPLLPVTEHAWVLVNALAYRNLLTIGQRASAITLANDLHTVIKDNAGNDPNNTRWQYELSMSHGRLGHLAASAGDPTAARTAYNSSLTIRQRLAETDPTNTRWQHALSISHERLGDLASAAGDLTAASTAYNTSLTIRQRLADADPTNTRWQRDLSIAHERLGDLAASAGDPTAARTAYNTSLTIRQRLAETDPTNTEWQLDLSISHERLGDLAFAAGDLTASRDACLSALIIRDSLIKTDPANTEWQSQLAISYDKLGDLAVVAAGDQATARAAYTEARTIRQRLADTDPTNIEWRRDLAVSHNRLGDLAVDAGDLSTARAAFATALTIAQSLVAIDPTNIGWQRDLAVTQKCLEDLAVKSAGRRHRLWSLFRRRRI